MRLLYRDGDQVREVDVRREGDGRFAVEVDGVVLHLEVEVRGEALDLRSPEGVVRAWTSRDGARRWVTAPGVGETSLERLPGTRASRRDRHGGGLVSPMPGKVVKVLVAPGDEVDKGQTLLIVEAMKTELAITAPRDGRVKSVSCQPGMMCEAGRPLVDLED